MCNRIDLKFYLSSNTHNCLNDVMYYFCPYVLDPFNSMYAEKLILNLSHHYITYHFKKSHNIWSLGHWGNFLDIPDITIMHTKQMLTGISGNTGESLIIPSLTHATGYRLNYCRISSRKKCPDFRIELSNSLLTLWEVDRSKLSINLPTDSPLEVKSHFESDNEYPITALSQLLSYWTIMVENNLNENVGVGIIARVNLKPDNRSIRYFLFIPKNERCRKYIIWICQCNVNKDKKINLLQRKAAELFL